MSHSVVAPTTGPVSVPTVNLRELAPWALFFGLFALVVLFFVTTDQGATSVIPGVLIHEWVHDGRHLLGYPCH